MIFGECRLSNVRMSAPQSLGSLPRADRCRSGSEAALADRAQRDAATLNRGAEDRKAVPLEPLQVTLPRPVVARVSAMHGYHGHFADPEGFLWEIAWNPAFVLAADGSLKLPD